MVELTRERFLEFRPVWQAFEDECSAAFQEGLITVAQWEYGRSQLFEMNSIDPDEFAAWLELEG